MKIRVLKTVGVSEIVVRQRFNAKTKKIEDHEVAKVSYLVPGEHDVTEQQAKDAVEVGAAEIIDSPKTGKSKKAKSDEPGDDLGLD